MHTVQCFIYHQLPSEFTAGITDYYKWHVILLIYTIFVSFSDWGEKLLERNNTRAMFEAIWYFIGKRKNVSNLLVALNVSVQQLHCQDHGGLVTWSDVPNTSSLSHQYVLQCTIIIKRWQDYTYLYIQLRLCVSSLPLQELGILLVIAVKRIKCSARVLLCVYICCACTNVYSEYIHDNIPFLPYMARKGPMTQS